MMFKKSLRFLIISALLLRVTCVVACEELGLDLHALSACHKQLATELIVEAQAAHKKAASDSEQLKILVGLQSFGMSMWSVHRSVARRADVGGAFIEINKLNQVKKTADQAITACTDWRDSTRQDCPAGIRCHQAIEALRKLQK